MPYLISDIPHFKCWVRKEYTCNHEQYHGEFIHGMAIAVNTVPDRCLSFQIIFTGCESGFDDSENVHGGAMWARMPITALVADEMYEEWPETMATHLAQPWDCSSHHHSVVPVRRRMHALPQSAFLSLSQSHRTGSSPHARPSPQPHLQLYYSY